MSCKSLAEPTSFQSNVASITLILSDCSKTRVSILPVGMSFITFSLNLIVLLIAGTFLLACLHFLKSSGLTLLTRLIIAPALNTKMPVFQRKPSS